MAATKEEATKERLEIVRKKCRQWISRTAGRRWTDSTDSRTIWWFYSAQRLDLFP